MFRPSTLSPLCKTINSFFFRFQPLTHDAGCAGQAAGRAHDPGHRAPPVHNPRRLFHCSGSGAWVLVPGLPHAALFKDDIKAGMVLADCMAQAERTRESLAGWLGSSQVLHASRRDARGMVHALMTGLPVLPLAGHCSPQWPAMEYIHKFAWQHPVKVRACNWGRLLR